MSSRLRSGLARSDGQKSVEERITTRKLAGIPDSVPACARSAAELQGNEGLPGTKQQHVAPAINERRGRRATWTQRQVRLCK